MVSSEEVRRTRGCRGRHGFSPAAAQGTLARQGQREQIQTSKTKTQRKPPQLTSPHRAQTSPGGN